MASLIANKSGALLPPLLSLPLIPYLAPGSFFLPSSRANPRLVLGLPHPAVTTGDVALYRPFRNTLRSNDRLITHQTLMWHLMNRRVQNDRIVPVSCVRPFLAGIWVGLTSSLFNSWRMPVFSSTFTDPPKPIAKRQSRPEAGHSSHPPPENLLGPHSWRLGDASRSTTNSSDRFPGP